VKRVLLEDGKHLKVPLSSLSAGETAMINPFGTFRVCSVLDNERDGETY
jgi:hypothetical protein